MADKYVAWADIKGTKYPLCLTIGAADAIEKEFGSLNAPLDIIRKTANDGKLADAFRAVLKTAAILAESGRNYLIACAQMSGDADEMTRTYALPLFPAIDLLESVLSGAEIMQMWDACFAATQGGTSRNVEVEPDKSAKNVESAT